MFDVIIIGAGVTGLSAAWYLTETLKKKVLLVEQFPFPHQFGSSAGHSRITRQLYDQDFNCILMKEATDMWRDLEKKSGDKLFIQNGLLTFGSTEKMGAYFEAISSSGISARQMTALKAKEMFPNFCIPDEYQIIHDPVAGVLRADRCLKALLTISNQNGLEFHEMEKVSDISVISEKEIKVTTNKNEYRGTSIIIAAGIWSQQFLRKMDVHFPLEPVKIHYAYFKPFDDSNLSIFNYENLPSFICTDDDIYGLSGEEYPGCLKIGDFNSEEIDPDRRDSEGVMSPSKELFLKNVQSFLSRVVPKCRTVPVNITTCVIMKTNDEQPIIDCHKEFKNVIIGCGFSGSGFKTGVIHGKLLGQLACGMDPSYDIKYFALNRFSKGDN